jgi:uncharacterized membrane protein
MKPIRIDINERKKWIEESRQSMNKSDFIGQIRIAQYWKYRKEGIEHNQALERAKKSTKGYRVKTLEELRNIWERVKNGRD